MRKQPKIHDPQTVILGSSPKIDGKGDHETGIKPPLFYANGRPVGTNPLSAVYLFNEPKPLGEVVHFRSEGARRRWNGDFKAAFADPKGKADIIVVPLYRGISARLANQFRASIRKARRKSMIERIKEQIRARMGQPAIEAEAHV